ncbi:MAG TPA: hypothetical protein VN026_05350 [Bacteroidia bacterium]|jgi:hypothetical protein|nr:hypothetical protein [Bacteroidia bacterium]
MKKIILIALMILTFGIAKAHMVTKAHPAFTQKKFIVTGINRLKNYNVTFNVYSIPVKRSIAKNRIDTTVNSLGLEVNQTKIAVSSFKRRLRSRVIHLL